jgi:hypothetical protein
LAIALAGQYILQSSSSLEGYRSLIDQELGRQEHGMNYALGQSISSILDLALENLDQQATSILRVSAMLSKWRYSYGALLLGRK